MNTEPQQVIPMQILNTYKHRLGYIEFSLKKLRFDYGVFDSELSPCAPNTLKYHLKNFKLITKESS